MLVCEAVSTRKVNGRSWNGLCSKRSLPKFNFLQTLLCHSSAISIWCFFFFILLKYNFIKNTFKFQVQNKTWCSGFDYHLRTVYSKSIYLLYIRLTLCDLPVEVLLKIFGFLHLPDLRNLLSIRKRFQHICDSPTLWRYFCFAVDYTRSSLDHIFQHAHFLRSFSVVGYIGQLKLEVQPEYIEATIGWCIELTELHISYNCTIQNLSFLLNMPNL